MRVGKQRRKALAVAPVAEHSTVAAGGLVRRYWVEGWNLMVEFTPEAFS